MTQEQLIEEAIKRFSKKFTDNILEGGYGNDLIIGKEDVEPLLDFFVKELSTIASKSAEAERNKHIEIYRWLCGYYDFPERLEGIGAYWWRSHLMQKLLEIGIKTLSKGTK
jgi:hypothetical protein